MQHNKEKTHLKRKAKAVEAANCHPLDLVGKSLKGSVSNGNNKNVYNGEGDSQQFHKVETTVEENPLVLASPQYSTPKTKTNVLQTTLSTSYVGFNTTTIVNIKRLRNSGHRTRRLNMSNSMENSNEKSASKISDNLAATILSPDTSVVGYVRLTPRKDKVTPSPKYAKKNKDFVSPIDKLLKKNGSMVDTLTVVDMNVFDENNTNADYRTEKISSPAKLNESASLNANWSMEPKEIHNDEVHTLDFVVATTSAKSPSTISMDSAKGSSIMNEGSWTSLNVGDLFWGQIYNYCYWPCMVCPDPDGKGHVMEATGRYKTASVHVRFFADNGRRNWVKRENLLPFINLENYQEYLDDAKEKFGPKSSKLKLFLPTKRMQASWYQAVTEACLVAEVSYVRRLKKFDEILKQTQVFHILEKQRPKPISTKDDSGPYSFTENVEIANHFSTMMEIEHSVSPFSPAYSPIKVNPAKKRKMSRDYNGDNAAELYTLPNEATADGSDLQDQDRDHDIRNSEDFRKFYSILKDFILEQNVDDTLERNLFVATRNIWALKHLSYIQLQKRLKDGTVEMVSSSINHSNNDTIKRLSNRIKSLSTRKVKMLQQQSQQQPNVETNLDLMPQQFMGGMEKRKPPARRPIEEVISDIFALDPKYLFKGMNREPVCKYCLKPGNNLVKCSGNCLNWLHIECLTITGHKVRGSKPVTSASTGLENSLKNPETIVENGNARNETDVITCTECTNNGTKRICSVCQMTKSRKQDNDPLMICSVPQCDRAFHLSCCKYWPQAKTSMQNNQIESFRCPCHVCHTCVSDDPREKFQYSSNTKFIRCLKCPATYHCDSTCIPAGSKILTAAYIICPRHATPNSDMTVNVNWCFICVTGGQLVCCETCPIAVHAQCLNIRVESNENYICEECESGRMPLYGEIVWAKFNNFRWWPAIILPPPEVPLNISKMPHNPSDFVVRFFGTHDHGWISRRRVYLYVEGDCSEPPKANSRLDFSYKRGVEEAKRMYEIIKNKKYQLRALAGNKEKVQPLPYVRIKVNRAVQPVKLHYDMENISKCECKPDDDDPCGPTSNCLNRALYHECNAKMCPAGEQCRNRMFESRISPRLDVVYMKERGFGLVCREYIPSGTFIIEYVGEVINDNEFKSRMLQKSNARDENFYFLSVEKDYIIDAGPKGNLARFMNHSCDPNCETQKWIVNSLHRVGLFAIKDIPENTELTFNYHWDDLLGNEKKTCFCGSKNCSGQIGVKPKETADNPKDFSTGDGSVKRKLEANAKGAKNAKKRRKLSLHTKFKIATASSHVMEKQKL